MTMEMEEFRVSDVARILDVSPRNLSQWCDRGMIRPERPAEGSGTRNLFSLEDLCRTALFLRLAKTFSLHGASAVAFASKGHPVHLAFFTAIGALRKHEEDAAKRKSLLSRTPPPVPVYVAFAEGPEGMEASHPCSGAADLAKTIAALEGRPFFLVVNLCGIAAEVLERIREK